MARSGPVVARRLAIACCACLIAHTSARADEFAATSALPESVIPSQWLLTERELESAVWRYELLFGAPSGAFLEEVTVESNLPPLKMRDLTQEIWTGPAAPFWALFHPAHSWRIFLPVPPKRAPSDEPVPDS